MRIAVYGGSFNPPHVGHAMVAAWLVWTGRVDEVWIVPAFAHPFAKVLAPYEARIAMCRALAEAVGEAVRVHAIEHELPVPSYTVDTLRRLASLHPDHTFQLVLGADTVADLPQWRDWQTIARDFAPIVVGRQGYPTPEGAIDFPGISSTEIRRLVASGEPVDHLVPAGVRALLDPAYWRSGPKPISP